MTETEICRKISDKIKTAMKEKDVTLEKIKESTNVPVSTLHDQINNLSQGKFVPIKYLLMFEEVLEIEIIFFKN